MMPFAPEMLFFAVPLGLILLLLLAAMLLPLIDKPTISTTNSRRWWGRDPFIVFTLWFWRHYRAKRAARKAARDIVSVQPMSGLTPRPSKETFIDQVISDMEGNPQSWMVLWEEGVVTLLSRTMKAAQVDDGWEDGFHRANEVMVSSKGKLIYRRRKGGFPAAKLLIKISRQDRKRLRTAFDGVILRKMAGATNQTVV